MMSTAVIFQINGVGVLVPVAGPELDCIFVLGDAGEHPAAWAPAGELLELAFDKLRHDSDLGVKRRCQCG